MTTESKPAPGDFSVTLSFESRLKCLWTIRAVLEGILGWVGAQDTQTSLIQLAVSEIASNAIEHGYRCQPDHKVDITIKLTGEDLEIVITDDAPPIPEDRLREISNLQIDDEDPDENWPMRGHGLQIVRKAVDSLAFNRVNNRNLVSLRKHLILGEQKP